jgi:RNA polymerase sigma-70 factor, ECF subfamily
VPPTSVVPGTDADLADALLRTASGDQGAFSQVYDAVAGRLHGLVLRVVRNPAIAEEVTQEVFLQVWRTADGFDPGRGSALSWLMTLAHRRAVDRVRSEQAQSDRMDRYETLHRTEPYDVTAEEVQQRWDASRVRVALDEVGEPHRSALELAYFEGLTHREVAERLDIPLGTAKTRIRDGLRKTRDVLRR